MAVRMTVRAVAASLAGLLVLALAPSPAYADRWRNGQWHLAYLDVAGAHKITQGEGVVVAVIDSGVDHDHPDLEGNVLKGWDAVTGGTGDGWGDLDGHGTGMASLIAGHGHGAGNRDGVLGIAPKTKIFPIRMETAQGSGNLTSVGNAIEVATKARVDVISISLNGGTSTPKVQDQIRRALESDIVIVVSIGNKTDGGGGILIYSHGTLPVGAVDRRGDGAGISITDPAVQLVAPGKDIQSASKLNKAGESGYRLGSGSSPSAAIVAGAAALIRSRFPDMTAAEVIQRLTYTARDLGPSGRDQQYGFGQVDLVRALTATDVPTPNPWPWPLPSPTATAPPPATASAPVPAAAPPADAPSSKGWFVPVLGVLIVLAGTGLAAWSIRRRRQL
ncbi:S8 family serine peptidase [Micromonospora maritima]|uniref:S8 family serine peptidase n=1 Tax=Micromonospora maritima TaxID=986711 RepID=A0ABW7ZKL1_9ACTN